MLTEAIRLLEQANNYSIRLQMGEDWCVSVDAILAAHNTGAREPIGFLPEYELERLQSGHNANLRSAKFGPSKLDGDVSVYLSYPQPITDAARDVMDHETALLGCRILSNIVSAYEDGNHGGRVIHLIGVAKSWIAELERLDRAKGE